ncbi:Pyruvate kinase [Giardia muris]|uniref:Pyruvate kinase n=1 Tax=Giardia muris TaxID=5742 RepID=A0A4Z1T6V8_GIAMU|nr:Pyruvate kinase [Giardia muris]|eukprot:TNJ28279.1 Pyruvate kinase [Giardia muris]
MHAIHERAAKGYPGKLTAANLIAAPAYGGGDAPPYRRGKVIVTLGPGCNTREAIAQMLTDGVDAFRIMMAKATNEENLRLFNLVREVADEQKKFVPIIASLQGPKFRITGLTNSGLILLQEGQTLEMRAIEKGETCNAYGLFVDNPSFFSVICVGAELVFRHTKLILNVLSIDPELQKCIVRVMTPGLIHLADHSSFRIVGRRTAEFPLTDVEYEQLHFLAENTNIDWICFSHINTDMDIRSVEPYMAFLRKKFPSFPPRIMLKVETPLSVTLLREIMPYVDGVMIARGALGEEMELGYVPVAQKTIIGIAREFGKPSYVASSVCDSMYDNIIPTRAEVSDVNNALADGCDGLVLCRETAIGEFAIQAARYLIEIVTATETDPLDATYCGKLLSDNCNGLITPRVEFQQEDALSIAAVATAKSLNAKCICVFSIHGCSILSLVRQRPGIPIVVFTAAPSAARWMSMLWGVKAVVVPRMRNMRLSAIQCDESVQDLGLAANEDLIVMVCGSFLELVEGSEDIGRVQRGTNHIFVHRIGTNLDIETPASEASVIRQFEGPLLRQRRASPSPKPPLRASGSLQTGVGAIRSPLPQTGQTTINARQHGGSSGSTVLRTTRIGIPSVQQK